MKCARFYFRTRCYWLREFHADGLRVDAVASMLYLDYSREPGDWIPNKYGGRENLEALDFLKRFNELAHKEPGAVTIAENPLRGPAFHGPCTSNGLGFTMKWNMGWMHDMLNYFSLDPVFRKFHQQNSRLACCTRSPRISCCLCRTTNGASQKKRWSRRCPATSGSASPTRARFSRTCIPSRKETAVHGLRIRQTEEWTHHHRPTWHLLAFDFHSKLRPWRRS